jgi:hypothetical protein
MAKAREQKDGSFAILARAAIEKHVPEARGPRPHWGLRPNLAWVRWARPGGGFSYLALRRHLNWLAGEAALASEARELEDLPLGATDAPPDAAGYRVGLGEMIGESDRWWPAGASAVETSRQLEWIVLQLRVKADAWFARHPLSRAPIAR